MTTVKVFYTIGEKNKKANFIFDTRRPNELQEFVEDLRKEKLLA